MFNIFCVESMAGRAIAVAGLLNHESEFPIKHYFILLAAKFWGNYAWSLFAIALSASMGVTRLISSSSEPRTMNDDK